MKKYMKRLLNKIKVNLKLIIGIIIGSILTIGTVYAATILFASNEVSYNNTSSGMDATNVQGAIDELYIKLTNRSCPIGFTCHGLNNFVVNPNGGSVSVNGGSASTSSVTVTSFEGQTSTYTATSDKAGYEFSGYTSSGTCGTISSLSGDGTYTYPNSKNTTCTLTANFTSNYINITTPTTAQQFYNSQTCNGTNKISGTTLACDGTSENNLRYVGSTPSNYVTFNGESGKWRIIGVMKGDSTYNTKYSSGTAVYRYKIIRDTIGSYSWDNKPSGTGTSTNSNGSNAWEDARIMTTLNSGAYYNRENGTCYSGSNGGTTSCNFSSSSSIPGLTEDAKSMISNAKWNIAGYTTAVTPSAMYTYERGTTKSSVMTTTEWTGRVGLMYPSDYGYAVGGTVRSTCLNTNLGSYNSNSCYTNDWLFTSNAWTLTPYTNLAYYVFYVYSSGILNASGIAYGARAVRPVLYLDSSVKINGGKGTIDDPYTLSM